MGLSNHKSMFSRGENINQRRLRLTRARPNFAADGPDVVLRVGRPTLGANNQMKGIRNNKMAIIPYIFHRHTIHISSSLSYIPRWRSYHMKRRIHSRSTQQTFGSWTRERLSFHKLQNDQRFIFFLYHQSSFLELLLQLDKRWEFQISREDTITPYSSSKSSGGSYTIISGNKSKKSCFIFSLNSGYGMRPFNITRKGRDNGGSGELLISS